VQAARFVQDTNNLAKLDDQPWDENVKAVSRFPSVIEMLNTNLSWTVDLGQAFLEQQSELMDAIQDLRAKAQKLENLKTTPQQIVIVTNTIIEKTIEQKLVYVTNTIIQVVPSNPQIIYVPTYPPYYVYYRPPPYYVGPPPIVSFTAGIAVGLILANNCNWHHRGIYVGHHGVVAWRRPPGYRGHGDVNIKVNKNVNIKTGDINIGGNRPTPYNSKSGSAATQQKWQADQSRLNKSGGPGSTSTAQARGWKAGDPPARVTPATTTTATSRPADASIRKPQKPSAQTSSASSSTARPTPSTPSTRSSASNNRSTPPGQSAFGDVRSGQSQRGYGSRGSASRDGRGGGGGAKTANQK
jgi:hypothetical protein